MQSRFLEYKNQSRAWYQKFEEEKVNSELKKYASGVIKDSDVRKGFLDFANQIFEYHRSPNKHKYKSALQTLNEILDYVDKTVKGYGNFLSEDSISTKLFVQNFNLALKLVPKEVIDEAQRDFLLLASRYLNFFVLKKESKAKFKSTSLNTALGIEFLQTYLITLGFTINSYIERFENVQFAKKDKVGSSYKDIQKELKGDPKIVAPASADVTPAQPAELRVLADVVTELQSDISILDKEVDRKSSCTPL